MKIPEKSKIPRRIFKNPDSSITENLNIERGGKIAKNKAFQYCGNYSLHYECKSLLISRRNLSSHNKKKMLVSKLLVNAKDKESKK